MRLNRLFLQDRQVSLTRARLQYSLYECWMRLESQGSSRTETFWISLFQIQPPWQIELQPSRWAAVRASLPFSCSPNLQFTTLVGEKCLQESVRTRTQFRNTWTASAQQDFAYEASVEYMAEWNIQQNMKGFNHSEPLYCISSLRSAYGTTAENYTELIICRTQCPQFH